MARDEIEGRRRRGGDPGETTGEEEEEDVPRKSPGTSEDRKQLDEGGI
jgi:hypothetical protein